MAWWWLGYTHVCVCVCDIIYYSIILLSISESILSLPLSTFFNLLFIPAWTNSLATCHDHAPTYSRDSSVFQVPDHIAVVVHAHSCFSYLFHIQMNTKTHPSHMHADLCVCASVRHVSAFRACSSSQSFFFFPSCFTQNPCGLFLPPLLVLAYFIYYFIPSLLPTEHSLKTTQGFLCASPNSLCSPFG